MAERRSTRDRRSIAIFHYEWPLQSQTANLALELSEQGYEVYLLFFGSPVYADLAPLRASPRVYLREVKRTLAGRALRKIRRTASALFRRGGAGQALPAPLIAPDVLRAFSAVARARPCAYVGVEKKGLIAAGKIAARYPAPLLYHSLELYLDDYENFIPEAERPEFRHVRSFERSYHRACAATIVQDEARAAVLRQGNGIGEEQPFIRLPVSLRGGLVRDKSRFLHHLLDLPESQKLVLYAGACYERRFVIEAVREALTFPDDWTLVLHGEFYGDLRQQIEREDVERRVKITPGLVDASRIDQIIASADIGLALYSDRLLNDKLTAFSSEKMAWYAKCGVPFIAFDYPGFAELARTEKSGVTVHRLDELGPAIARVLENATAFRENAFRTFRTYYSFERSFRSVARWLEENVADPSSRE